MFYMKFENIIPEKLSHLNTHEKYYEKKTNTFIITNDATVAA